MDPGNTNDNLKGPAETAPPPDTQANTGVTGAVDCAAEIAEPPGEMADPADLPESASDQVATGKKSVKSLAMRGSAFVLCGNLSQQLIRFASNLILARLLLPEAFGLMQVVTVVLIGLQLFSDIGIGPSIIQHKRGDDPKFFNTAWTVQVLRGLMLSTIAISIVSPIVHFIGHLMETSSEAGSEAVYTDPRLIPLICAGSITASISGFNSTKLFTANRNLAVGKIMVIEVSAQLMGVLCMASWAWYFKSVWALVCGSLAQAWLRMLLTHVVLPGEGNRFFFERESFGELLKFGRWIFLSTAALFIAAQGDRLLLGAYVEPKILGIYGFAYFLSEALNQLIDFVSRLVFLPAFSHVARDKPERLKLNYYQVRLRLDALTLPMAGGLMMVGQDVVNLLYPDVYEAAGWILQILAIRVALACTLPAAVSCLLAIGDSKSVFAGNLGKTIVLLIGIPLGHHLGGLYLPELVFGEVVIDGGVHGVIWAIALSELGSLPIIWWRMSRHGLLRLSREALAGLFVLVGIGVGYLVHLGWAWLWN